MNQIIFDDIVKKTRPNKHLFFSFLRAFMMGGLLGITAQGMIDLFTLMNFEMKEAMLFTASVIIFLTILLTGFGVYHRLGPIFGAGLFIPISGFANSIASATIEYRAEGFIYGLGSKVFSLAGSVILYGIIGAFLLGLIRLLLSFVGVGL